MGRRADGARGKLTAYAHMYEMVCRQRRSNASGGALLDEDDIRSLKNTIQQLHAMESRETHFLKARRRTPEPAPDACVVCFTDFEDDSPAEPLTSCGHSSVCGVCVGEHVRVQVRDGQVHPWIACPAESCKVPLAAADLIAAAGDDFARLRDFVFHFLKAALSRRKNWVSCTADDCDFGFIVNGRNKKQRRCTVCSTRQLVVEARADGVNDAGMKSLVSSGVLRACPQCGVLQMKDYGLCNVMQCPGCQVWWNWRSRSTGRTYAELKDKARASGTLWEPGELNFQLDLQRTDPEKFKNLLERNGMKYDPNFVRGQS